MLCCNCKEWKQAPNPEIGTCIIDGIENTTRYDCKCIYGLSEQVDVSKIEEKLVNKSLIDSDHFLKTVEVNINNDKLTDVDFRNFVRNTLPIVDYKNKS